MNNNALGMSKTKFHHIFIKAVERCEKPYDRNYIRYGAKGIKVDWTFEEFYKDMYSSFLEHCQKFGEKNTTLERIDSKGNYCKENCKWVTYKQQGRNKSNNHVITFKGQSKCMSEWEEELGLPESTLSQRIKRFGWSEEKALTTPIRKSTKRVRINGKIVLV